MGYFELRRDTFMGSSDDSWWGDGAIAVYQFKGVEQTQSLTDLTGHGYTLSMVNSPTWDRDRGYFLKDSKYLNCSVLNALGNTINTIIVRYSALPSDSDSYIGFTQIKGASNTYFGLMGRVKFHYTQNGSEKWLSRVGAGVLNSYVANGDLVYRYTTEKLGSSGVLAATRTKLYKDGNPLTTSSRQVIQNVSQVYTDDSPNLTYSYTLSGDSHGGHYVAAAAFYSDSLSADRIREISEAMAAL